MDRKKIILRLLALILTLLIWRYDGEIMSALSPQFLEWLRDGEFAYKRGPLTSLFQISFSLLVVFLFFREEGKSVFQTMGLAANPLKGFATVALAIIPAILVFSVTETRPESYDFRAMIYLALISPVAEEVFFRGLLFGRLRQMGFGFWTAVLVPALLFGFLHILGREFDLFQAIGVFGITTVGALIFSWLYERWGWNLWVPIALHVCMNSVWEVFEPGSSAFAGLVPTIMQVTTILLAIGITVRVTSTKDVGLRARAPITNSPSNGD